MTTLDLADREYAEAANAAEGQSAQRFVENLEQRRDRIREMANLTRAQVGATVDASRSAQSEHLQETADHLDRAVSDVKAGTEGYDVTIQEHDGDIAGMAYVGQEGTATLDPVKSQGERSVVDKDFLLGVSAHEQEHTQQALQDVDAVKITAKGAVAVEADQDTTDPSVVTAKQFIEAGAVAAQIRAAPKSFEGMHDEYKGWYRKILAHGSPDRVQELARKKDGLRTFAAEALAA